MDWVGQPTSLDDADHLAFRQLDGTGDKSQRVAHLAVRDSECMDKRLDVIPHLLLFRHQIAIKVKLPLLGA
jgi:hypothetical protein